jgi:hypothetical protein
VGLGHDQVNVALMKGGDAIRALPFTHTLSVYGEQGPWTASCLETVSKQRSMGVNASCEYPLSVDVGSKRSISNEVGSASNDQGVILRQKCCEGGWGDVSLVELSSTYVRSTQFRQEGTHHDCSS